MPGRQNSLTAIATSVILSAPLLRKGRNEGQGELEDLPRSHTVWVHNISHGLGLSTSCHGFFHDDK